MGAEAESRFIGLKGLRGNKTEPRFIGLKGL